VEVKGKQIFLPPPRERDRFPKQGHSNRLLAGQKGPATLDYDYVFNAGVPPATAYSLVLPALLDDLFLNRPACLLSTGGSDAVSWLLGERFVSQLDDIAAGKREYPNTACMLAVCWCVDPRLALHAGRVEAVAAPKQKGTPGALNAMATAVLDRAALHGRLEDGGGLRVGVAVFQVIMYMRVCVCVCTM